MAISSPEEFLKILVKSKLLTAEQLAHAQDAVLLTSNAEQFAEILIDEGFITEWQAERLLAGQIEFVIGNYLLLGFLGRGGMGSVFLARHKSMKRRVALKIISRRLGKDPASRERLLGEARSAALLDHPNIVRAFDLDEDRGRPYIVMEFVDGHDLEELVELEGLLDFEFIVDCIRQAAEGLAHAHQRHMVHCDIKPSNLLVTETGTVKILDMGMARLMTESAEDSSGDRDGRIMGTVDYMAPEQALDGPEFDHRADIYSLGCTMYFMLTGHPPFDEGTLAQRIVQHQTQPPPDILEQQPDTPADLAQICLKMMAKDPADRYQSAQEVAAVLANWHPPQVESEPSVEEPVERKSTGVAIDEEDFKAAEPDEDEASGSGAKPILSDERRLVFWMAVGAIVVGGLLAVVAVLMILRSNDDAEPRPENLSPPPAVQEADRSADDGNTSQGSSDGILSSGNDSQKKSSSTNGSLVAKADRNSSSKHNASGSGKTKTKKTTTQKKTVKDPLTSGASKSDSKVSTKKTDRSSSDNQSRHQKKVKPKNPLKEFPAVVALPPVMEKKPFALGKLMLSSGQVLSVELLGGTSAIESSSEFSIEASASEALRWNIRFVTTGGELHEVAALRLERGRLMFAWAKGAEDVPAEHLKNCLFSIRVGDNSRIVPLRKARAEKRMTLDLAEGGGEKQILTRTLPKKSAMRMAITRIGGLPVSGKLRSPIVIKPGKTVQFDVFRQKGCSIILRASYEVSELGNTLDVTVYYRLARRNHRFKFSRSRFKTLYNQRKVLELQEKQVSVILENPYLNEAKRKAREEELKQIQGEFDWVSRLIEAMDKSDWKLTVDFYEYIAVGKRRVVVDDTRLSEPDASSKEEKKLEDKKKRRVSPRDSGNFRL